MQIHYTCLFSSQVTKKKKTWQDGTCIYYVSNKKLVLKDSSNITLTSDFRGTPPADGDELDFKGYVAQILDGGTRVQPQSVQKPYTRNINDTIANILNHSTPMAQPHIRQLRPAVPAQVTKPVIKSLPKRVPIQHGLEPKPTPNFIETSFNPIVSHTVPPAQPTRREISIYVHQRPQPQEQSPVAKCSSCDDLLLEPYMINKPPDKPIEPKVTRMRPVQLKPSTAQSFNAKSLLYNTIPQQVQPIQATNIMKLLAPFDPSSNKPLQLASMTVVNQEQVVKDILHNLETNNIQYDGEPNKPVTEYDRRYNWTSYLSLMIARCSGEILYSLYASLSVQEKETALPTPQLGYKPKGGVRNKPSEDKAAPNYEDSDRRIHKGCKLIVKDKLARADDDSENETVNFSSLKSKREIRLYLENCYKDGYAYGDVWIISQNSLNITDSSKSSLLFAAVSLYHMPMPMEGAGLFSGTGMKNVFRGNKSTKGVKSRPKQPTSSYFEGSRYMISLQPITNIQGLTKSSAPIKVQAIHLKDSSFIAAALKQLSLQRGTINIFENEFRQRSDWSIRHILSSDRLDIDTKFELEADPMFDNSLKDIFKPEDNELKSTFLKDKLPKEITELVFKRVIDEFMLNEDQTRAIETIKNMVTYDNNEGDKKLDTQCMLLEGVYGCGKSRTLMCIMIFLWMCGYRILVLSGTNVAVDRILVDVVSHLEENEMRNAKDEVEETIRNKIKYSKEYCDLQINPFSRILSAIIRLGSIEGSSREARRFHMSNECFRKGVRPDEVAEPRRQRRVSFVKTDDEQSITKIKLFDELLPNIVFSTCASYISAFTLFTDDTTGPSAFMNTRSRFDVLIIDECCQIPEYLSTVCAALCMPSLLILAGDERQLPPVTPIGCNKRTLLGRLLKEKSLSARNQSDVEFDRRVKAVNLGIQYRCNEEVAKLTSDLFYSGSKWDPAPFCPVGIVNGANVSKYQSRCSGLTPGISVIRARGQCVKSTSQKYKRERGLVNVEEAKVICSLVKHILLGPNGGQTKYVPVEATGIGIIAPYRSQCAMIKKMLNNMAKKLAPPVSKKKGQMTLTDAPDFCKMATDGISDIVVSTVDSFQGQEKNIIIVSVCREYGRETVFTSDTRRVNVAMSRAMEHLIIIRSGAPSGIMDQSPWDIAETYGTVYDSLEDFFHNYPVRRRSRPPQMADDIKPPPTKVEPIKKSVLNIYGMRHTTIPEPPQQNRCPDTISLVPEKDELKPAEPVVSEITEDSEELSVVQGGGDMTDDSEEAEEVESYDTDFTEEEPSGETITDYSSDSGGVDGYYHSSQDPDYRETQDIEDLLEPDIVEAFKSGKEDLVSSQISFISQSDAKDAAQSHSETIDITQESLKSQNKMNILSESDEQSDATHDVLAHPSIKAQQPRRVKIASQCQVFEFNPNDAVTENVLQRLVTLENSLNSGSGTASDSLRLIARSAMRKWDVAVDVNVRCTCFE